MGPYKNYFGAMRGKPAVHSQNVLADRRASSSTTYSGVVNGTIRSFAFCSRPENLADQFKIPEPSR